MKTSNTKPKILMVDDLPDNLYALDLTLRDENYELDKAFSGEEALKKALKTEYSMFLLDVQMPGMDGFEVASFLKSSKRTQNVPIIFVTAISKDQQFVKKGFEIGAIDYLAKPVDEFLLKLKVKTMIQLFQQQRDLEEARKELKTINERLENLVAERTARLEETNYSLNQEIKIRQKTQEDIENKNKELEMLFYKLSHDLRGPLTTCEGLLNLAFYEFKSIEHPAELYFEKLTITNQKLKDIIDKMRQLSQITINSEQKVKIDVMALLEETKQNFREELLARNINMKLECRFSEKIWGNSNAIKLILENLVENSIQFYNNKIKQPYIRIFVTRNTKDLILRVKDNGQGIPKQYFAKAFEMFFKAHEQSSGSGLGLYLVKNMITGLGGNISLKSKEKNWTHIEITIPYSMSK